MKNEKNKTNIPKLYHGRKPVTRRELLASGAIPFMASMTGPSLMSLFARSGIAEAQELCKANATVKMMPFVTVNLNGGWGATRNWIALTEGRELLPHYGRQGLGSAANLVSNIVKEGHFKNKPNFYSGSGFLAGVQTSLVNGLGAEALSKANFLGLPLQSQNDSDTNKFDATALVSKLGYKGRILPNLGRVDNGIGVSNATAFFAPPAPLIVNNVDNIVNALGVADRLGSLSQNQKASLFRASSKLSEVQARNLASLTGGSLLQRLLGTSNSENVKLIENPSGLDVDPLTSTLIGAAQFRTVWGLTANTAKNSNTYINASLIFNAINGNAGTVSIELGGYDYHGSDLATTNQMDTQAGTLIGQLIQSFHVMGSPGFIHVVSDGGVGAPISDTPGVDPTADRGDAGAAFSIAYDPTGSLEAADSQLGHMKSDPDAEAADDRFIVGGNPEIAAAAVVANYLNAQGMGNLWSTVPELNRTFDPVALEKIIKFHGKAS